MKKEWQKGLYFIPLGGSEEFGVNLNVYICDGTLLAVDCGLGFADERYPGIDILLPDPTFLEENKKILKALIITHAHEDHIGAVAHLWDRLECPIYCTAFTASVLRRKFEERGLKMIPIKIIAHGNVLDIKPYKVEIMAVSHSVPDACALGIVTPHGNILHSGDWNLDPNPVVGTKIDAKAFSKFGDQGVMAYIGDSTNAGVPGLSGSERDVSAGLAKVIKECTGKVAVTIFSSNVGRIISIAEAAKKCGREVALVGRSIRQMAAAAEDCGYLAGRKLFSAEEDVLELDPARQLLIVTGSQGESRAALAKIARKEHPSVKLKAGDTVIFSARAIPGNEKEINVVKNNLAASGIKIVTPDNVDHCIHVSGHPCQDEIIQMYQWVRPQIVIPVHGERSMLEDHAALALRCQIPQALVPQNGSVIGFKDGVARIVDQIDTGLLAVDQKRIVPVAHGSITERRKLQYSGVLHVSLVIDKKGKILGEPLMDTMGLFDLEQTADDQMEERLYNEIFTVLKSMDKSDLQDDEAIEEELTLALRRLTNHLLGIKPKTNIHVHRV